MRSFEIAWAAGLPITPKRTPMIDATITAPLDLTNYALRAVSLTEQECDLVWRVMTIALDECATRANNATSPPLENLSATWLRDEIKRIAAKFGLPTAAAHA